VSAATLLFILLANVALAADRTIGVFVALADNKSQGIVPVPAAIGNGDDPEQNLYWGNSEGLKGYFDHNKQWKLIARTDRPLKGSPVLRTRTYRNPAQGAVLYAQAYRGNAIRQCLTDFDTAVQMGSYDMVVYIGHNGLMDFNLPKLPRSPQQAKRPDCAVLCCKSEAYFKTRLTDAGGHPILLTTQLMYPGAFVLGAAAETWLRRGSLTEIRNSAGSAYAKNQRISRKAGTGVFAIP
jgi:hypothetical protein